jgi:hypothetical protein
MKRRTRFHPPNLTASALAEIAGVESRRAGKRQPREPTQDTNTGRRRCGSGELRRKRHYSDNTVSFWFKTTAENIRLCAAKRYTSYNNRWSDHVIELEKGLLRFSLKDDAPLYSKTKLNDGNWHHVITSVGPGGQRLHVDGQLLATGKLPRRAHTSNRLGLDLGPGASEGTVAMDEVRVLNGAATAGK